MALYCAYMHPSPRPHLMFLAISSLFFLAATLGADILAQVTVGHMGAVTAMREHLHFAYIEPIKTILLFLPFLLTSWISSSLALHCGSKTGATVVLIGCFAITLLYFFYGYLSAATNPLGGGPLTIVSLPVKAIPIIIGCAIARLVLIRNKLSNR